MGRRWRSWSRGSGSRSGRAPRSAGRCRWCPAGRILRHDLGRLPWPEAPADLVYARYVLSHLPDPEERMREWMTQLRPGGLLVLEENEWIDSRQPAFTRYLELVAELLAGRGQ